MIPVSLNFTKKVNYIRRYTRGKSILVYEAHLEKPQVTIAIPIYCVQIN